MDNDYKKKYYKYKQKYLLLKEGQEGGGWWWNKKKGVPKSTTKLLDNGQTVKDLEGCKNKQLLGDRLTNQQNEIDQLKVRSKGDNDEIESLEKKRREYLMELNEQDKTITGYKDKIQDYKEGIQQAIENQKGIKDIIDNLKKEKIECEEKSRRKSTTIETLQNDTNNLYAQLEKEKRECNDKPLPDELPPLTEDDEVEQNEELKYIPVVNIKKGDDTQLDYINRFIDFLIKNKRNVQIQRSDGTRSNTKIIIQEPSKRFLNYTVNFEWDGEILSKNIHNLYINSKDLSDFEKMS